MTSNQIESVKDASFSSGDRAILPSVTNEPQLRLVPTGQIFPLKTSKHTNVKTSKLRQP